MSYDRAQLMLYMGLKVVPCVLLNAVNLLWMAVRTWYDVRILTFPKTYGSIRALQNHDKYNTTY